MYGWHPPSLDERLVSSLSRRTAGIFPPSMNGPVLPLADGLPSLDERLRLASSLNEWLASSLSRRTAGVLPPSMNGPVLPFADGLPSLDEWLPTLLRRTASSFLQHMASSFS